MTAEAFNGLSSLNGAATKHASTKENSERSGLPRPAEITHADVQEDIRNNNVLLAELRRGGAPCEAGSAPAFCSRTSRRP